MCEDIIKYSYCINEPNDKTTIPLECFDIFFKPLTITNIRHAIKQACYSNNMRYMLYLCEHFTKHTNKHGLYYASRYNNLDMIKLFINCNCEAGILGATKGGHLDLVKFFVEKKVNIFKQCLFKASQFHHTHIINYYIENGVKYYDWGLCGASKGGHMDLVKFFIEKGANNYNDGLLYSNSKELIYFFIEKGANNYNDGIYCAVKQNDLELVEYLINKGAYAFEYGLSISMFLDNSNFIDYFINLGACDWDKALVYATKGNHLHLVEYCIDMGASAPYDIALEYAIENCNYDIIEKLIQYNGCDLNNALLCAIGYDLCELVVFFVERGAVITDVLDSHKQISVYLDALCN